MPSIGTDHNIIDITMDINKLKRGPGFWKLNNSLLDDENYKLQIGQLIQDTWDETQYIDDLRVRFDFLKYTIMTHSIKYSKSIAKKNRKKEFEAIEIIQNLDDLIINNSATNDEIEQYDKAKQELDRIETIKANGASTLLVRNETFTTKSSLPALNAQMEKSLKRVNKLCLK